jgi:hypothetical protein
MKDPNDIDLSADSGIHPEWRWRGKPVDGSEGEEFKPVKL